MADTITPALTAIGAPTGPVPSEFLIVPAFVEPCQPEPTGLEAEAASLIRQRFLLPDQPNPYLNDFIRAFRLLRGASTYLEIGTFDRGNLAYAASLMADDALLIGVDIQPNPERDARVTQALKPSQRYENVTGNSHHPEIVSQVRSLIGDRPLDAVFIDGDHTAYAAMCDYVNFGAMVRPGGFVLFHDSLWEGDERFKGVSHALREIDRLTPIYLIPGRGPCYRFLQSLFRDPLWGVIGAIKKADRKTPHMSNVTPEWTAFRKKDDTLRAVFDGYISACRPDIICDIGAFNADESVRFKKLSPESMVFAFEANERNLREFIMPREDIKGISVFHLAVADHDGKTTFHQLAAEATAHDWRRAAGSLLERSEEIPSQALQVGCVRLDTFFQMHISHGSTFALWIDVEGASSKVLQGATNILRNTIILHAEVERHSFWKDQGLAREVIETLKSQGFVLIGDSYTRGAFEQSNVLFLNENWLDLASRARCLVPAFDGLGLG